MKFFSAVQTVDLPPGILSKAKQFAEAVTNTTNYADTNQTQTAKVINDHFISKLGEEAAKMVLSPFATVVGPDYAIYGAKEKSWQADLFVNGVPLAVKTQKTSAALRYGLSWTFQCSTWRKDTILQQPDAWVLFTEYNDVQAPFCTCYVLPPYQIRELQFGEPRLPYLKGHKKVVYASSLTFEK